MRARSHATAERPCAAREGLEGWAVDDVGATHSYDLCCQRGSDRMYVEVKGTTGPLRSIVLTGNEVRAARTLYPQTALIVVYGIELLQENAPAADGGTLLIVCPWQPEESA